MLDTTIGTTHPVKRYLVGDPRSLPDAKLSDPDQICTFFNLEKLMSSFDLPHQLHDHYDVAKEEAMYDPLLHRPIITVEVTSLDQQCEELKIELVSVSLTHIREGLIYYIKSEVGPEEENDDPACGIELDVETYDSPNSVHQERVAQESKTYWIWNALNSIFKIGYRGLTFAAKTLRLGLDLFKSKNTQDEQQKIIGSLVENNLHLSKLLETLAPVIVEKAKTTPEQNTDPLEKRSELQFKRKIVVEADLHAKQDHNSETLQLAIRLN